MPANCSRCGEPPLPDGPCPRCLANMAERLSSAPAEENPLQPGDEFRGMEIVGLIARGGMGIVYKATQPKSGRLYAVKILPRALAEEQEFRDRFSREVRAMAGLKHPHIVGVHDYGIEDGLAFLVMDFIDGQGLRQRLRKGRLPLADALRVAGEVLDALGAAHRQGVVHRDIKPDNVLLDAAGSVKVTDFGLAKVLEPGAARLTESNIVVGTPHYMAPEQMERPREVDRRADVYSFGVLLYETLTGGLPIGRFALPSEKGAGNPALDELVLRCLEAEPSRRFPDALSLKEAFLRATGSPESPPPRPARERNARNMPITCGDCGWTFYIPATERGHAKCPSCRLAVPIVTGGRPASATPPPALESDPLPETRPLPSRKLPWMLVGVSGALLLALAAVAIVLLSPNPAPPPEPPRIAARDDAPPSLPRDPGPLKPVEPPPPPPDADVDYDARLRELARQCNMAAVVGAVLLHGGKLDDCLRLDDRVGTLTREIVMIERRREQLGRGASPLPDHARKGDRLVALDDVRLEGSPKVFADGLRAWLRAFKPGVEARLTFARGANRVSFPAGFPERGADLVALARWAEVELGEGAPAAPPPPEVRTLAIPHELRTEITRRLDALPPYFRERVLSAEQDRARRLLKSPAGTAEDVEFLRQRVLAELIPAAAAELDEFRSRAADLEGRVLAAVAGGGDVVVFKDGRRIEGTLETAADGSLRLRKGPVAMAVRKDDILRVEKGKTQGGDFPARWQAARGREAELDALLRWCGEQGLKDARLLTAYELLALNPAHDGARAAAGFSRDASGAWSRGEPTGGSNGLIEWHGRTYTPEELAQELRSMGHVLIGGLWHARVSGVFKVDNLYRDAEKLTLRSGQTLQQLRNAEDMVYDVRSRSWQPRPKTVSTGRYLGGQVLLEISAPGELLECRVRARGQVAQVGGALRVFAVHFPKDPAPKLLYSLNGPGEHWQSIDVSEKVRGVSVFYLAAEVGPDALFLPSDSNDLGILEVRYVWAQPLRRINELLGARPADAAPGGNPQDAAHVEAAVRKLAEFHAEKPLLLDMMRNMRSAVELFRYHREVEIPARFQGLAALIEDPLRPKLEERGTEQLLRVGEWWGSLPMDERKLFATIYGLWCARARTLGK